MTRLASWVGSSETRFVRDQRTKARVREELPTLGLGGLLMGDGRPPVIEHDLAQARWLYQGYSDPVRLIMRGDLDVAPRRDDIVDCLPDKGLDVGDVD